MTGHRSALAVEALHFYGRCGDPGMTSREAGIAPTFFNPEKALAWAFDRIERPFVDDPHPGRVVVMLREGRGHGVSCDVWVRPSTASPGRAAVDVHPPAVWGTAWGNGR